MSQPFKLKGLFKLLENKYFLFINSLLLTLLIGFSKFINFPINYYLIYFFFFNLFFFKFQKHLLLKNKFLLFLLLIEVLYFFYLDKFELRQLAVLLFFNFFIISILVKEIPSNFINGLKTGVYCIFVLDIVIMLIRIITGEFLGHFGFVEIFYNYKYWPELRVNGLLQSPILSSILSIIVFLFSFYYKDKFFLLLSILFCNLSGSLRASIFILVFFTIYYIFLFFFLINKINIKKNLITIFLFFSFYIIIFFFSFNSFTISAKIRYLMFNEFVKCYSSIEICKKDLHEEKKVDKDIIKIHNKAYYDILQNIKKNNPDFAELLTNKNKINSIEISKLTTLILEQEYLTKDEISILMFLRINSSAIALDPDKYADSLNKEKLIKDRVELLSNAKTYENHYLTGFINEGIFSIIFRFFFILYLLFYSLKKFITYQYKNIFSFSLIISLLLSSFFDTIIFSYFFVIYVWLFLFFIIHQKENYTKK